MRTDFRAVASTLLKEWGSFLRLGRLSACPLDVVHGARGTTLAEGERSAVSQSLIQCNAHTLWLPPSWLVGPSSSIDLKAIQTSSETAPEGAKPAHTPDSSLMARPLWLPAWGCSLPSASPHVMQPGERAAPTVFWKISPWLGRFLDHLSHQPSRQRTSSARTAPVCPHTWSCLLTATANTTR